jgi:hypothetical protein
MTLEKTIETRIRRICEDLGCVPVKFCQPGVIGAPDRLILCPGGVALFLEVKRPGEVPTPHQLAYMGRLRAMGFRVRWTDRPHNVKAWIENALQGRDIPAGGDPLYL